MNDNTATPRHRSMTAWLALTLAEVGGGTVISRRLIKTLAGQE